MGTVRVGVGEVYVKGHDFPDYPLGTEEPRLFGRDRFVDAVREKAPDAFREIETFAERLLKRLDPGAPAHRRKRKEAPEAYRELESFASQRYQDGQPIKCGFGSGRVRYAPSWTRYVWCYGTGRMIERAWTRSRKRPEPDEPAIRVGAVIGLGEMDRPGVLVPTAFMLPRPVAPRAWRCFVRGWNERHSLSEPANAWVAEWILHRVVVGERDPGLLAPREFEEQAQKQSRFDAIVPSNVLGPWRWISSGVGPLVPIPVLPGWDTDVETRGQYRKRAEAVLTKYMNDVESEVKRRDDLARVPSKPQLERDLRRLVRFQLQETRLDAEGMPVGRETYSDTHNALARVAQLIGLTLRLEEPAEPVRRRPPRGRK